ncbi:hypothetical protein PGH43_01005 [Legionella pneumophila 130b]|nr:hypothetical protein PGH43_01005 [Legionella pneumophila 130b]
MDRDVVGTRGGCHSRHPIYLAQSGEACMSRKILDRYIAKTVLSAIGLVTLMLVGLQILFCLLIR